MYRPWRKWHSQSLFQVIHYGACQYLYTEGESILINVEAWMMVRIVCAFFLVFCAYDEVATRDGFEEVCHVVTARFLDCLSIVYLFFSHRSQRCFAHYLCHTRIIHARRATVNHFQVTRATH